MGVAWGWLVGKVMGVVWVWLPVNVYVITVIFLVQ